MTKRKISVKSSTLLNLGTGMAFALISIILVIIINYSMRQQALVEAESKARILLDRNLATHTYFSQILKPNLFEWTERFRSEQYFDPSWMSSSYAVREIDKSFQEFSQTSYYIKDAAINARSPENEADAYEITFLQALRSNPDLTVQSSIRMIDGQPYFVTLRPGEVLEESCMRCHSDPAAAPAELVAYYGAERSFHREDDLGHVISAISIQIPLSDAYGQANRFSLQLSGLLLMMMLVWFAVHLWLQRLLVFAPLESIRSMTHQISVDPAHLGEEIPLPFAQDLASLVVTFNRMSVKLRQGRDHLEEQVMLRTADLATTNENLEREITERKQAQSALQAHSWQLENIVAARTRELVEVQERLIRHERLAILGQLAGGVGHELRSPLAVISNAVYLLKLVQPNADEQVREYLGLIEQETRTSEKIITDLLDFSRVKPGKIEKVRLAALIERVLIRFPIPANIALAIDLPEKKPVLQVDPLQIEQVLGNLVLNACQAMPEGGKLVISAQETASDGQTFVAIHVEDTGTGISSENMNKIFTPLFSTKSRGIGLGLVVCKMLAEANAGRIEVHSEPGVGSIFSLYLPGAP